MRGRDDVQISPKTSVAKPNSAATRDAAAMNQSSATEGIGGGMRLSIGSGEPNGRRAAAAMMWITHAPASGKRYRKGEPQRDQGHEYGGREQGALIPPFHRVCPANDATRSERG